jgi:HD-GYP domain-containing protein (c-di-GMP phosphodiesterase class II)
MRYLLLHAVSFDPTPIGTALEAEQIRHQPVAADEDLKPHDGPTVLLLDPDARTAFSPDRLRGFVQAGGAVAWLGAPSETDVPDDLPEDLVQQFVPHPHGRRQLLLGLRSAFRDSAAQAEIARARNEAALRTRELGELTRIGMALSTERDYNTLLELILEQALRITGADAGSLYIVENPEEGERQLRFKYALNHSRPDIPFVEMTMPLNTASIAGYAASTGEPLVIDDVYYLPPDVDYTFNRSIDEKYGYRTRSQLTIPMKDHWDETIGVLQLINRKRDGEATLATPEDFNTQIVPFSPRQVELVSALAGQAAVSIENSQLYEDIERLFEGFVKASVTAIEQRDPTTFGHSGRVAAYTVGLAKAVDRADDGPYTNVRFSRDEIKEIRYAGLLHDFGKVGVREQVLVKAKKLYPPDLALLKQRFAFIRRTAEAEYHRKRADFLAEHGEKEYAKFITKLQVEHEKQLEELDHFMELITQSNEPTVLPEGSFEELLQFAERYYDDIDGQEQPFLTDDEVRFLTIRKGSLDESERLEIESHVAHTYRFLMQIPWTKELQFIPDIAYGHHEKLDGTGYPRRVKGDQIPIQTRMMTISDIFDALTAADRPYKRAVPVLKALDILGSETEAGMLDPALFNLFTDAKVFETKDEGV